MASAPNLLSSDAPDHKRYFLTHLGLTERLLERCLGEALSAGGEFADLYFEAVTSTSLGMDEGIVKTAAPGHQRRLRHSRSLRRAHRLRLHRRPQPRAPAQGRAHRGPHRQRPANPARSGLQRDAHTVALPRHRRYRGRRDRREAQADRARQQGRPRLRFPHHAGPRLHQ